MLFPLKTVPKKIKIYQVIFTVRHYARYEVNLANSVENIRQNNWNMKKGQGHRSQHSYSAAATIIRINNLTKYQLSCFKGIINTKNFALKTVSKVKVHPRSLLEHFGGEKNLQNFPENLCSKIFPCLILPKNKSRSTQGHYLNYLGITLASNATY